LVADGQDFAPFLFMEAETSQSTETYYKVLAWAHANRNRLLIGLAVVVVAGVVAGIVAWHNNQQEADANASLFNLPLATAGNPAATAPPPGAYLDIARQYPGTSAGEYAELLAAESLFVDGKFPDAQHEFSSFLDNHSDSALVPQAKMGMAASLEAQGKIPEAIQQYQAIVSSYPSELNVISPAKLTLARLLDQENHPDQALNLYADLARSQNPGDPWAAEARERAQLLLAKHPELRRTEPTQTSTPFSMSQPASQTPSAAPAAPTPAPAPQIKTQNPPINLLPIPASSNPPGKP
jgi:predicted negative regulator of RcsB-dependent stress response